MASTLLLKRSNTAGNDAYTGLLGEVTVDTQERRLRLHDNVLLGGHKIAKVTDVTAITDMLAQPDGIATLDGSGLIPSTQLPSYVEDVIEFPNLASFPATGETGKIYVALDDNKTYRWSGSTYIYITSGAVDSVAGKTGVVTLVKADVGLANVDNTSDANKPVSTLQQAALNLKANLASPTLTGTPLAPTATTGTNTTQIATTAFVQSQIGEMTSGVSSVTGTAPIVVGGTSSAPVVSITAATTSATGSMSSADKIRLNGIEEGAQVNTVTSVASKTGAVVLVKGDVGLGSVQNYAIATKAEAEAATTNVKYMTPLKTAELIDEYTIDCGTF